MTTCVAKFSTFRHLSMARTALYIAFYMHVICSSSSTILQKDELCPASCVCCHDYQGQYLSVNCSGRGLTTIPGNISTQARALFLDYNNISQLHSNKLLHLDHLELVNLSHNAITSIEVGGWMTRTG